MNQIQNAPQPHGLHGLSDNNIEDEPACRSPGSDSSYSASIFSNDDGKSSSSSTCSSPDKSDCKHAIKTEDGSSTSHKTTRTTIPIVTPEQNYPSPPLSPKRRDPYPQRTSITIEQLVNDVEAGSWSDTLQATESAPTQKPTNPRRTSSTSSRQACPPPLLTRQCDRTHNFVENLVDTSTQMIEVIWPTSIVQCDKDYLGGRNLIGLRTFIQEVLKRSKTSYYTLLVALYYLVLIQSHLSKDPNQTPITHAQRVMQCGRRMFLAALILASKYLQDRNYSARAWSKISGLKISEINSNEIAFVTAVDWKLHIPEEHFQRWTNIVYKYSASQQNANPLCSLLPRAGSLWKQIVPLLTPELDSSKFEVINKTECFNFVINRSTMNFICSSTSSSDGEKTPTPSTVNDTRPKLNDLKDLSISSFSTPITTPSLTEQYLPSVAPRTWSHGQSMREAAQKIQQETFTSTSLEPWAVMPRRETLKPLARVLSDVSIMSSPESMISDNSSFSRSSRTSRSSSICSIASTSVVARGDDYCQRSIPAKHRSALAGLNGSSYVPTCVKGRSDTMDINSASSGNAEMDATLALLKIAKEYQSEHGQKRARPLSICDQIKLCQAGSEEDTSKVNPLKLTNPMSSNTHQRIQNDAHVRKKQRSCSNYAAPALWNNSKSFVVPIRPPHYQRLQQSRR